MALVCIIGTSLNLFSQTLPSYIKEGHAWQFPLEMNAIYADLVSAPHIDARHSEQGAILDIPLFGAGKTALQLFADPICEAKMLEKYSEIHSYKIYDPNKNISGRMTLTPKGINGLVYVDELAIFVESLGNGSHISYLYEKSQYDCMVDRATDMMQLDSRTTQLSYDGDTRQYSIAIASSGEWSAARNSHQPTIQADIVTYINELNAIYERELNVRFSLTPNNDNLIFYDAAADGLDPNNRTTSAQNVISSIIPANEYDIGHVFYEISHSGGGYVGSGVAGLNVVCNDNRKAEGWTGMGGNYSTMAFMDIFAHEVAHQFGATHSFYGTSNFCAGSQRTAGAGYEPGSGNSMMSYEGSCGANGGCTNQNISPYATSPYFHVNSLHQIRNNINAYGCHSILAKTNSAPVVTVPGNKYIPKNTAFTLEGSATDADGDPISYHWEEYDTDSQVLSCPNGAPNDAANSTTAPLFRSVDPSSNGNVRTFPRWADITSNTQTMGEILPNVARDIKMRLTARDGRGGVTSEEMTLTVTDAGPLVVTIANSGQPTYLANQNVTVTWNSNNTELAPINATTVDILLSTDGGLTYPHNLATAVSNDGSHTVTIPTAQTNAGRIMVKAHNNYFFDINDVDIKILGACSANAGNIIDDEMIQTEPGNAILNMQLYAGEEFSSYTGTLDANDAIGNLNCRNNSTNGCAAFGNQVRYETIKYRTDRSENYTVTDSAPFPFITNLYDGTYIPNNSCQNWLASNSVYTTSISPLYEFTILHDKNKVYELKMSSFNLSSLGNYSIGYTQANNGKLYRVDNILQEGYDYTFIIIDGQNNIRGIDTGPDLSNANVYGAGVYTIKGISYQAGIDLSPYTNGSLTQLENDITNGTLCGNLSGNSKTINLAGDCLPNVMVTSAADSGTNSLRQAIADACPGAQITIASSVPTITLDTEINITQAISITGNDNNGTYTSIRGTWSTRLFNIASGAQLTLNQLRLAEGYHATDGGAFYNSGTTILNNCLLESNYSVSNLRAFSGNGIVKLNTGTTTIK